MLGMWGTLSCDRGTLTPNIDSERMIYCTLREDLLVEIPKLARQGGFDYLLVESTRISARLPVA